MVVEVGASPGIALPVETGRKEEEVRRLFDNAPIGLAGTVINASIVAGILRDWIEPSTLAFWWGSLMAVTALRFAHCEWFRRIVANQDFDAGKWAGAFTAGTFASGLVWGAAGVWLLPQSVAHQTFVAFVLGGMVAGASATYSIRMDAFLAYAVPLLAPLAIRFFAMGDELHVAMGGMVVLFGVLLTATAVQVHRLTSRTYDLSGELIGLQSALKAARESARSLEARLERAEEARAALARERGQLSETTDERVRRHAFTHAQEPTGRRMDSVVDSEVSTDLGEFLRGFARRWEASRPANIDVWWNWSVEPLAVRASPSVLEVLFGQLLTNAREAIGEERGSIEVRARRTAMDESDDRESYVTVEVIDDGAAMSRTTVDPPFESLVGRHRGRVYVESALLRGTVVRLLLPEAATAVPESEEEHP
jgi:signal transduction histidine kinase